MRHGDLKGIIERANTLRQQAGLKTLVGIYAQQMAVRCELVTCERCLVPDETEGGEKR